MNDKIQKWLNAFEIENNPKVLFAVESGSRGWGFASPDSDYDVRFVFANNSDHYSTLFDTFEHYGTTTGDLDIKGWSSKKALSLMLKGNFAIREWLHSPIVYRNNENWIQTFKDLASQTPSYSHLYYGYRSLVYKCVKGYLSPDKHEVNLKKYFYALRCSLACMWLDRNRNLYAVPPMSLNDLINKNSLGIWDSLMIEIYDLMGLKSKTSEMGMGPRFVEIDKLINTYVDIDIPYIEVPPLNQLRKTYDEAFKLTLNY